MFYHTKCQKVLKASGNSWLEESARKNLSMVNLHRGKSTYDYLHRQVDTLSLLSRLRQNDNVSGSHDVLPQAECRGLTSQLSLKKQCPRPDVSREVASRKLDQYRKKILLRQEHRQRLSHLASHPLLPPPPNTGIGSVAC